MTRLHDPRGPAFRRAFRQAPKSPPGTHRGAAPPPSRARPTRSAATALWLAAAAVPGLAAAGPAPEYGPEAEARFLDRCADGGATARSCRRLMERLQAELGYAVFLDLADGGPEGFGRGSDDRVATAAAPAPVPGTTAP
jgi:hypothetical protein